MRAAHEESGSAAGGAPAVSDRPALSLVRHAGTPTVDAPPLRPRRGSFAQSLRALVARCPQPGCGRRGCPGPSFHTAEDLGWYR
jgi:hypothetical protein